LRWQGGKNTPPAEGGRSLLNR